MADVDDAGFGIQSHCWKGAADAADAGLGFWHSQPLVFERGG